MISTGGSIEHILKIINTSFNGRSTTGYLLRTIKGTSTWGSPNCHQMDDHQQDSYKGLINMTSTRESSVGHVLEKDHQATKGKRTSTTRFHGKQCQVLVFCAFICRMQENCHHECLPSHRHFLQENNFGCCSETIMKHSRWN